MSADFMGRNILGLKEPRRWRAPRAPETRAAPGKPRASVSGPLRATPQAVWPVSPPPPAPARWAAPSASSGLGAGVVAREARVVEQAQRGEARERAVHGGRWMLLLQQAAAQVEARVGAARQGPQRGPVRTLEIGELLQPCEDLRGDLCAN